MRAVEVRSLLSNPICLVSHLVAQASAGAPAGTPVTVWVKRMDVPGARYVAVKGVDLQETVDDFTARWVAQAKLDLDPSLVTLRLVACGSRKPSAAEEEAAVVLDDPRLSLAAVCFVDSCSLLAYVVGSPGALCLRSYAFALVHRRSQRKRRHACSSIESWEGVAHGCSWCVCWTCSRSLSGP